MIVSQETKFFGELNVQDHVDFRIESDEAARLKGKHRKLGNWLFQNDEEIQKKLFNFKEDIADLKDDVKHFSVVDKSLRKHDTRLDQDFEKITKNTYTLTKVKEFQDHIKKEL